MNVSKSAVLTAVNTSLNPGGVTFAFAITTSNNPLRCPRRFPVMPAS